MTTPEERCLDGVPLSVWSTGSFLHGRRRTVPTRNFGEAAQPFRRAAPGPALWEQSDLLEVKMARLNHGSRLVIDAKIG